jgi:hypothetical protein
MECAAVVVRQRFPQNIGHVKAERSRPRRTCAIKQMQSAKS